MRINPLNAIDFYKADHRRQYPVGTTKVYSNFTARSDRLAKMLPDFDGKIVVFGIQYFEKGFLQIDWQRSFFDLPKDQVVKAYKRRMDNALGKDSIPTDHIEALHDLGYLPIKIKAVDEGSRVPMKTPILTITNTHPDFFWLVNYLESVMSCMLWKACTSATTAYEYKRLLTKYAIETGAPLDFVNFQAHDFSFRGMSGITDAVMSGAAHLTSFWGTDTVPAIDFVETYYNADSDKEPVGFSVPATEHSVMCMGGKESEIETFRRLINDLYPSGIVSIVSDTWDFWKVVTEYVTILKDDILKRAGNPIANKVVLRPDSGDPVKIICGEKLHIIPDDISETEIEEWAIETLSEIAYSEADHGTPGESEPEGIFFYKGKYYRAKVEIFWNRHDKIYYYLDGAEMTSFNETQLTPQEKGAVQCLWEVFGGTITDKGFNVLDSHIGLIYGDSITLERAGAIMEGLKAKGFASCNVVFGVGSYTYEYVTRDTFGFAVKSTYGEISGAAQEIFKDPITDSGVKKSAKGLIRVNEDFSVSDQQTWEQEATGMLQTVFEDGKLVRETSLAEIRKRLEVV